MLNFMRLIADGFCSIGNLDMSLNTNTTTIIHAANGGGKSSIFSAFIWCLYGKNIKGISSVNTWQRYRPKNYSGTKVEVYFENNGKVFKIIRCQNYTKPLDDGSKGGDRLLVYVDAELLDIKGKSKIQEYIEKQLGMSYNIFMNSIMFGQGLKRLIQESNTDKKKLFEEIFDLGFINNARDIALDSRYEYSEKVSNMNHKKDGLLHDIETFNGILRELLDETNKKIDYYNTTVSKLKSLRKKYKADISKLEYDDEIIDNYTKELSELRASKLSITESTKITVYDLIDKLFILLRDNNSSKAFELINHFRDKFKMLGKVNKRIEKVQNRLTKLHEVKSKYDELRYKLHDVKDDLKVAKSELDRLINKDKESLVSKYQSQIKRCKHELKTITDNLAVSVHTLNNINWVVDDPLGNNGLKAYIFDSSLNLINDTLAKYSELLGFNIEFSVNLESNRKEFVTLIEKDGVIVDYDELSGGEKQLVNIAMAFAMNEVLTASKGINIAFLDEVFESLSSDNIEVVVSLVKHVFNGKTLFLITHHESLPLSNCRTMMVEKVNGLSSYKIL